MEWKTTEKGNPRWIQWKTQRIWTFWWNLWEKWNKIKLTVQNRFRNRRLRWNCCIPLRTSPKRYIYIMHSTFGCLCVSIRIFTLPPEDSSLRVQHTNAKVDGMFLEERVRCAYVLVRYCMSAILYLLNVGRNKHVFVQFCIGCVLEPSSACRVSEVSPRTHKRKTHNRFNYILSWLLAHSEPSTTSSHWK